MSKPKWHEAWREAFDDGFDDEAEPTKRAIAVRRGEDGSTEFVRAASGDEALKMIAEAEAAGLSVEQNETQVEALMAEQTGATDVPQEVYQLMSVVVDFAQELCQEWRHSRSENLSPTSSTEIEYGLEDL